MKYQLIVTSDFSRDLYSIIDNLRIYRGAKVSRQFSNGVTKALRSINDNPFQYRVYYEGELASLGWRRVLVMKYYRIFYYIDESSHSIVVARIIHSSRDVTGALHADR